MNQGWSTQGCSSCRSSWESDAGRSLEHIETSIENHAHLKRCKNCGALWLEEERFAHEVSIEAVHNEFGNSEALEKYMSRPLYGSTLLEAINKVSCAKGSEAELDHLLHQIEQSVPHPEVSDLIFWPQRGTELSAEEIAKLALEYQPIAL